MKWQTGNKGTEMGTTYDKGHWLESNQGHCCYVGCAVTIRLLGRTDSMAFLWDWSQGRWPENGASSSHKTACEHAQTACISEIRCLTLSWQLQQTVRKFLTLLSSPMSNWNQPSKHSKWLYVPHEMYWEGSCTKEQHEALIITSNGFIFGSHIRS